MSRPNFRRPTTPPRSQPRWPVGSCWLLLLLGAAAPALAFGNIDPASSTPATASASLTFKCGGAAPTVTYALDHDSGLYETGPNANRMKHVTLDEYLPYTFTLTPASGNVAKNIDQAVTVAGTVSPASFQDATMGAYADTVVVTLNP